MKVALIQMNSGDTPEDNLTAARDMIRSAASDGAEFVCTPEVTNCLSSSRSRQEDVLATEVHDPTLAALRDEAARAGIWLSIGSLALKTDDPDGRFANRSFLIAPDGSVAARYDKIHMFDVDLSETESYRESAGYRPGQDAVVAPMQGTLVGLTVCYDLRFPHLHRALAQAGARILLVPAAFAVPTGRAHWEVLLRARAIETGCFVLAAAQTGTAPSTTGHVRKTWGHSLAIAPWGEVLADGGTEPGVTLVELDLAAVDEARRKVPSLSHDRPFKLQP